MSVRGTATAAVAVGLLTGALLVPLAPASGTSSSAGPHDHGRASYDATVTATPARLAKRSASPRFVRLLPERTTQAIRTVSSDRWCGHVWCTVTQLWEKDPDTGWATVRRFRSTIGPEGFGKRREGDHKSPSGRYRITVTFSTGQRAPGDMPWKQRLPTSNVTNQHGRLYNTWIEEPWRTDGDRASMRWGLIVDYNNPRLAPGVGPKPKQGKGSGIFYHTSLNRSQRWRPTDGCTQIGRRHQMRFVLRWLDPRAHPWIVQDR